MALCVLNPPVMGGFLSNKASNAVWWRHALYDVIIRGMESSLRKS